MANFDFSALSPDLIIDGLESAGFVVDSGLLPLNSYETVSYTHLTLPTILLV